MAMKISHKISWLIIFLLLMLFINTAVGLLQLSKIGFELKDVASKDVVIREISASLSEQQLEGTILFERILNMAEEIAFENPPVTRRQYLQEQLNFLENGFSQFVETGALSIIRGKEFVSQAIQKAKFRETINDLEETNSLIARIEKAHISYNALVRGIFDSIQRGQYQLSIEDLNRIERKEKVLRTELKRLKNEAELFIQKSLEQASYEEKKAWNILLGSIVITWCVGLFLMFVIVRRISLPLKQLAMAARRVGEGDFRIHLESSSKDEIGEVSQAFNVMADHLEKFRSEIEEKNKILRENLELTNSQKRDLEKVNQEMDNFVHTVSHDIAAPLMGILGYADYIKKHYEDRLDEQGQKCLEGIHRGVTRLNALVKDLVALTKLSRVKNPYEKTSMSAIIQSVLERLEYQIKKYGAHVSVPADLPVIQCDRIKITEVFYNLINNGIKYSSKNSNEPPTVEVSFKEQSDYYEFAVKDNGIGIDPKDQNEIFKMFTRLPQALEYEGTGAGLNIVKGMIEEHGGQIGVESQFGQGATFRFTISKNL